MVQSTAKYSAFYRFDDCRGAYFCQNPAALTRVETLWNSTLPKDNGHCAILSVQSDKKDTIKAKMNTKKDNKPIKKAKAGRKKIELDFKEVERLFGLGLSEKQVAQALNPPISWLTLHRNKKRSVNFVKAMERGKSKAMMTVANALYESATKPDNPSVNAQIFWLKSRGENGQWKDEDAQIKVDLNLNNILKDARERLESVPNTPQTIEGDFKNLEDKEIEEND